MTDPDNLRAAATSLIDAAISERIPTLEYPNMLINLGVALIVCAETIDRMQAHIDALMLEHCPERMTLAQKANWERHQQPHERNIQ